MERPLQNTTLLRWLAIGAAIAGAVCFVAGLGVARNAVSSEKTVTAAISPDTNAAAEFGTAAEAKTMLERAVAAVKEDKAKAIDMFNKGEGGFKDRDLYVYCANASDSIITATPYWNRGKHLREIRGKHGAPFGETIMQNATEGTIKETSYWWPRPGLEKAVEKKVYYTKVGDQICAVGYYEE
jgi:hypothetical protein